MVAEGSPAPDQKPEKKVTLHIRFPDADALTFKVKPTTPFEKMYDHICKSKGVAKGSYRLMFDGRRLQEHETPKMHEMDEEDTIDYVTEQVGGSASSFQTPVYRRLESSGSSTPLHSRWR